MYFIHIFLDFKEENICKDKVNKYEHIEKIQVSTHGSGPEVSKETIKVDQITVESPKFNEKNYLANEPKRVSVLANTKEISLPKKRNGKSCLFDKIKKCKQHTFS